jgi:hypothetical protein
MKARSTGDEDDGGRRDGAERGMAGGASVASAVRRGLAVARRGRGLRWRAGARCGGRRCGGGERRGGGGGRRCMAGGGQGATRRSGGPVADPAAADARRERRNREQRRRNQTFLNT